MIGDVVTLDSALQNSYAEHVFSGKSLSINYGTYITMQQTIAGDNISVNVSRAVSRLKTIFCSFTGDNNPSDVQKINSPYYLVKKDWNYFYHPMSLNVIFPPNLTVTPTTIYDLKKRIRISNTNWI